LHGRGLAAAWQRIDGRTALSPLALASIRTLADTMATTILAQAGRRRWCETAYAEPASAEIFLQAFPDARFVCLHRSCPDMVHTALRVSANALPRRPFAEYSASYPASRTAAIAAYWVQATERILQFEEEHRETCLRVRYEDLAGRPGPAADDIFAFLQLDNGSPADQLWLAEGPGPPTDELRGPGHRPVIPAGQLPVPLQDDINGLLDRLGYPPALFADD
jgi:Sulfotransferase family